MCAPGSNVVTLQYWWDWIAFSLRIVVWLDDDMTTPLICSGQFFKHLLDTDLLTLQDFPAFVILLSTFTHTPTRSRTPPRVLAWANVYGRMIKADFPSTHVNLRFRGGGSYLLFDMYLPLPASLPHSLSLSLSISHTLTKKKKNKK